MTSHTPFESPARLAEAIRAGDAEAIGTIYDAHSGAVYEYCKIVCGTAKADEAVVASFSEFLSRVATSEGTIDLDQVLQMATRRAAAARCQLIKPSASRKRGHRQRASVINPICRDAPTLLAERANGEAEGANQAELREHIIGCPVCRASALRLRHAERAFGRAPMYAPDPALRAAILNGKASS